jgi:hypothetical protein
MKSNHRGFQVVWEPIFDSERKLLKQYKNWFRIYPLKHDVEGFALISPILSSGEILDHPFRWIEERQIINRR